VEQIRPILDLFGLKYCDILSIKINLDLTKTMFGFPHELHDLKEIAVHFKRVWLQGYQSYQRCSY